MSSHFEFLSRAGALAPEPEGPNSEAPSAPVPCSGVFCSGSPAVPSVPHAAETFPEVRWAINETPFTLAGPSPSATPDDEADPRAVHLASSIFHPPRPA